MTIAVLLCGGGDLFLILALSCFPFCPVSALTVLVSKTCAGMKTYINILEFATKQIQQLARIWGIC